MPGSKPYLNNRGVALLITLAVITVMVTAALAIHRKTRSDLEATMVARDRRTLYHMAASGVEAAMALLVKDKNDSRIDSIQEDWADADVLADLSSEIPFDTGKLTLKITDELGRIQVNALVKYPESRQFNGAQRTLWRRFLTLLAAEAELFAEIEPETIISSVKDWLDSGDDDAVTGLNGAESDYYQELQPPYACRNGPLQHINELSLIKGITPELFEGLGEIFGISAYITVFGMTAAPQNGFTFEGKININTADLEVIAALLPLENVELAESIFDYRQETSDGVFVHELTSPTWYKNAPGCSDLEIDPELITLSSDFFRIVCEAKLDTVQTKITAVVEREKETRGSKTNCRVLSWYTE